METLHDSKCREEKCYNNARHFIKGVEEPPEVVLSHWNAAFFLPFFFLLFLALGSCCGLPAALWVDLFYTSPLVIQRKKKFDLPCPSI